MSCVWCGRLTSPSDYDELVCHQACGVIVSSLRRWVTSFGATLPSLGRPAPGFAPEVRASIDAAIESGIPTCPRCQATGGHRMTCDVVQPDAQLLARAIREREQGEGGGTVRPFVQELRESGLVRAEQWAIPMNTYERRHLLPVLESRVFFEHLLHCLGNISAELPGTYDWAVVHELLPEARRRLDGVAGEGPRESFTGGRLEANSRYGLPPGGRGVSNFAIGGPAIEYDRVSAYPAALSGRVLSPAEHAGIGAGGGDEDGPELVACAECGMARPAGNAEHESSCSLSVTALDTLNAWFVTAQDERVVVQRLPHHFLAPEEALRLASWLIVAAELAHYPQALATAVATVKAVRNT